VKTGIYARFSTHTQDKISIPSQIANCEALCSREGFDIVARYTDAAISGNDDHRPDYMKMLTALERGELDCIVADETSRVTRNMAELHRLVAELRFRDQYLITCDGVDTRSESSEILLSVKAAMDAMEGRKIGNRVYRSNRERHKAGHSAGGRIYGYTSVQDGEYKRRVIDEEQADVVRQIFQSYADGDSAKSIARRLNEEGIPSPSRKSLGWPHTTILGCRTKATGILRNTIYIGRPSWGKRINKRRPGTSNKIQKRRPESEWETITDESLRIIDDATWKRVQKRLNKPRKRPKGGRPPTYLLSGLLVCGDCGGSYTLYNGKSYRCSSKQNGRDVFCSHTRHLYRPKLERTLLGGIKDQLLDGKVVEEMARKIRKLAQAPKKDHSAEIRRIDKQITTLVDTLMTVGKSDALTARLTELEKRKAQLESVESVAIIVPDAEKVWQRIVGNLENLKDSADPGQVETARGLIQGIIGEVTITENNNGEPVLIPRLAVGCNLGAEERTLTEPS
jgi:DNA invertase Pin-like site-specific DNA recombinase